MSDPEIYPDPNTFTPERWYSKPEMVKHKDAFAPFSAGPFGETKKSPQTFLAPNSVPADICNLQAASARTWP